MKKVNCGKYRCKYKSFCDEVGNIIYILSFSGGTKTVFRHRINKKSVGKISVECLYYKL